MTLQRITEFFRAFFQTLFSLFKILILSKFFVNLRKYGTNDDECVILGNGPCLKTDMERNLDFIISRKKICVNLFAFSNEYVIIQPEYYVLAAPEFWQKNPIEFHINQRNQLANTLLEKTSWLMKLLVPHSSKNSEMLNILLVNKNIQPVFFNPTPIEGFPSAINLLFKNNLGIPRPHNVLIPSVFLAMNLGFKCIYIFGADHSWHEEIKVDDTNKVTLNHQHFYENKEVRMPMFKLDGKEYYLHDVFRKLHFAFKGYFILNNYADYLKAKIYNASSKSYIDAFEKVKLN